MTPCRAAPGPTPGPLGPAESHLCAPTAAQWQAGTQIQDTRGVTAPHAPGYPRRAIGVTPVTTSRESKAPRSPPGLGVLPPESGTDAPPGAPRRGCGPEGGEARQSRPPLRCLPAFSPCRARSSCLASFSSARQRPRSLPKNSLDLSMARGQGERPQGRRRQQSLA